MKYRPKHIAEYILLRVAAFVASVLPYRITLGFAWIIAWLAFHIFRFRRAETIRRMRSVFGDRFTNREYKHMAWISGRNTAFNAIELLIHKEKPVEWFDHYFDYKETVDTLKAQAAQGKGAIIAGPHTGTWDLAGRALGINGIPPLSIVAHQRNPLVNKYFDDIRSSAGIESLVRGEPGILKSIIRGLRKGEFLAIMPDTRSKTPGIELPFLGGVGNFGQGAANFARLTELPIFPVIVTRVGWTHHKMRILPAIHPDMKLDKKEDIKRMMTILLEIINSEIQADPEQWFWYNSRWVLDPIPK